MLISWAKASACTKNALNMHSNEKMINILYMLCLKSNRQVGRMKRFSFGRKGAEETCGMNNVEMCCSCLDKGNHLVGRIGHEKSHQQRSWRMHMAYVVKTGQTENVLLGEVEVSIRILKCNWKQCQTYLLAIYRKSMLLVQSAFYPYLMARIFAKHMLSMLKVFCFELCDFSIIHLALSFGHLLSGWWICSYLTCLQIFIESTALSSHSHPISRSWQRQNRLSSPLCFSGSCALNPEYFCLWLFIW